MCIFCEIAKGNIPSYKVYEDEYTLAFLDLSQATYGHTLVISKNHSSNLLEINGEDLAHVMNTVQKVGKLLCEKLGADGFNVLNNCNEAAGQTVMHTHFHILPRYNGDKEIFTPEHHNPEKEDFEKIIEKLK